MESFLGSSCTPTFYPNHMPLAMKPDYIPWTCVECWLSTLREHVPSNSHNGCCYVWTDERTKGQPLMLQLISKLNVKCIARCYSLSNKPIPTSKKAHFTRAMATSTAFLKGVPLQDFHRVTTWSSDITFAKHIDVLVRDSVLASTVLSIAQTS